MINKMTEQYLKYMIENHGGNYEEVPKLILLCIESSMINKLEIMTLHKILADNGLVDKLSELHNAREEVYKSAPEIKEALDQIHAIMKYMSMDDLIHNYPDDYNTPAE